MAEIYFFAALFISTYVQSYPCKVQSFYHFFLYLVVILSGLYPLYIFSEKEEEKKC